LNIRYKEKLFNRLNINFSDVLELISNCPRLVTLDFEDSGLLTKQQMEYIRGNYSTNDDDWADYSEENS